MNRIKVDLVPCNPIRALHYFALVLSDTSYSSWELREYTNFGKKFSLASKARGVVEYDRAINNEVMSYMMEKIENVSM